MDPQNSGLDCILSSDLKVFCDRVLILYRRSLLQHAVVCCDLLLMHPSWSGLSRDKVPLATVFVSSAYLFCSDQVSSVATDLSLAL